MPRPDDGMRLAGSVRDLVTELVDLGDRLLEIALEDVVGRHGSHGPFRFLVYLTRSFAWAAHFRDCRYRSDFGRRRISAVRRLRRNSSGPSKARSEEHTSELQS